MANGDGVAPRRLNNGGTHMRISHLSDFTVLFRNRTDRSWSDYHVTGERSPLNERMTFLYDNDDEDWS